MIQQAIKMKSSTKSLMVGTLERVQEDGPKTSFKLSTLGQEGIIYVLKDNSIEEEGWWSLDMWGWLVGFVPPADSTSRHL